LLRAGQRAKALVHQILTFSRRTAQVHTPVQLPLLVDRASTAIGCLSHQLACGQPRDAPDKPADFIPGKTESFEPAIRASDTSAVGLGGDGALLDNGFAVTTAAFSRGNPC